MSNDAPRVDTSYNPSFEACYDEQGYRSVLTSDGRSVCRRISAHDLCERFQSLLHTTRRSAEYRLISDTNHIEWRLKQTIS